MGYKNNIDPYVTMLRRLERKAFGYGFLALFLLVIAILVAAISSDGAGQLSPLVEQVRYAVGLVLFCGSGLSILAATFYIGRYVYFFKRPERFKFH